MKRLTLTLFLCGALTSCTDALQGHQIYPALKFCEEKGGVSLIVYRKSTTTWGGLRATCRDGTVAKIEGKGHA